MMGHLNAQSVRSSNARPAIGVEMGSEIDDLSLRVMRMFDEMNKDALDLHELFEAGGNDPVQRREVFFTVERLVERELLEERGNDFYALTPKSRTLLERASEKE